MLWAPHQAPFLEIIMVKYIIKRLLYMAITLFVIITLTFFSMKAIPGDPIAAKYDKASPEVRERIEAVYGLDEPVSKQYITYLINMVHGDLGLSITQASKTANDIIKETFPASVKLGITVLIWSLVFGIICGGIAGIKRNSFIDIIITLITTLGISIPNFVIASLLQYTFSYKFPILPPLGWENGGILSTNRYMILPVTALTFYTASIYTKYIREAVSNIEQEDFVLMARAKGLSEHKIMVKYVLKNALFPIITVSAQQVAMLLTGSVVVETIFSIPGIGRYFVNSVTQRDYTVIMAVTIFYSVIFMVSMLIMDILYYIVDPRMKESGYEE